MTKQGKDIESPQNKNVDIMKTQIDLFHTPISPTAQKPQSIPQQPETHISSQKSRTSLSLAKTRTKELI